MLDDIRPKKVNCVIVKDLSRFGRNCVEAGKYLEIVFPLFKICFIAVNGGIDSAEIAGNVSRLRDYADFRYRREVG